MSQLQHSPKFGTKGFTSPDPHTIAHETCRASTVPLAGGDGAVGTVLFSRKKSYPVQRAIPTRRCPARIAHRRNPHVNHCSRR